MKNNGIYAVENPIELTAKYLIEYNQKYNEFWAHIHHENDFYKRLDSIVKKNYDKKKNPITIQNLFFRLNSLKRPDLLKQSKSISLDTNFAVCICGGLNGPATWGNYMEVLAGLMHDMENEFGYIWVFDLYNSSDVHYLYIGINDLLKNAGQEFMKRWIADLKAYENHALDRDLLYFLNLGQHQNEQSMMKKYKRLFSSNSIFEWNGMPLDGVAYSDISKKTNTVVYYNNGKDSFVNCGFIDCGYVSYKNQDMKYYAKQYPIDNTKCTFCQERFSSISEFALKQTIANGQVLPGQYFQLESAEDNRYVLFDSEKWVDFYNGEVICGSLSEN